MIVQRAECRMQSENKHCIYYVVHSALFILHSALAACLFAADGPGTTGSPFLKIPISGLERIDIMATYVSYFEQTSLQAASIGFPVNLATTAPPHEVMEGAEFTP